MEWTLVDDGWNVPGWHWRAGRLHVIRRVTDTGPSAYSGGVTWDVYIDGTDPTKTDKLTFPSRQKAMDAAEKFLAENP